MIFLNVQTDKTFIFSVGTRFATYVTKHLDDIISFKYECTIYNSEIHNMFFNYFSNTYHMTNANTLIIL